MRIELILQTKEINQFKNHHLSSNLEIPIFLLLLYIFLSHFHKVAIELLNIFYTLSFAACIVIFDMFENQMIKESFFTIESVNLTKYFDILYCPL